MGQYNKKNVVMNHKKVCHYRPINIYVFLIRNFLAIPPDTRQNYIHFLFSGIFSTEIEISLLTKNIVAVYV